MKRILLFAAALLALTIPVGMYAQDVPQADPTAAKAPARTPDQILRFYDTKLALTDDQKTQLRPIIVDRQQKIEDLRAATGMRPRERSKKAQAIQENTDKRINAVLTPNQQKKYAEVEKQLREQAKERREEKSGQAP